MPINSFKQDEQSKSIKKTVLFRRLFAYLLDYKLALFLVCLIMAITTTVSIINPLRCSNRHQYSYGSLSQSPYVFDGESKQSSASHDSSRTLHPYSNVGI